MRKELNLHYLVLSPLPLYIHVPVICKHIPPLLPPPSSLLPPPSSLPLAPSFPLLPPPYLFSVHNSPVKLMAMQSRVDRDVWRSVSQIGRVQKEAIFRASTKVTTLLHSLTSLSSFMYIHTCIYIYIYTMYMYIRTCTYMYCTCMCPLLYYIYVCLSGLWLGGLLYLSLCSAPVFPCTCTCTYGCEICFDFQGISVFVCARIPEDCPITLCEMLCSLATSSPTCTHTCMYCTCMYCTCGTCSTCGLNSKLPGHTHTRTHTPIYTLISRTENEGHFLCTCHNCFILCLKITIIIH